jgi:hypothetical protein
MANSLIRKANDMQDWILSRAKAFVAFFVPAVTAAAIDGLGSVFGFSVPEEWKLAAVSAVTSALVYQVPNK